MINDNPLINPWRPGLNIRAEALPWRGGVSLAIVQVGYEVGSEWSTVSAKEIVFETPEEAKEKLTVEPVITLRIDMAQTLMDDLWACGLRPTEGTGSAGALRATERHLEDMRRLVFGLNGTEGKPPSMIDILRDRQK